MARLISSLNSLGSKTSASAPNDSTHRMTSHQPDVTDIEKLPSRYATFLDSLPHFYRDEQYFFVHAGLDMTKDDPLNETESGQMLWGDASGIKTEKNLHG